ncbi:hypothetical protein ACFX13_007657 [Malus domestica]
MEANRAWGEGGASAQTSEENAEAASTQHLRHSLVAGSQQNSPAFVHSVAEPGCTIRNSIRAAPAGAFVGGTMD